MKHLPRSAAILMGALTFVMPGACGHFPVAMAQQTPKGFAPCHAFSISATSSSSNIQLANCGPTVILMNLTSQEAFFNYGSASSTTASSSNYSLPGGAYIMITVPDQSPAGWYIAGYTSTSSTTIRILEGRAQ
jgi:hypothetical protein